MIESSGIAKNDPAMYWQTTGPMKEATVTIEFDKPCVIDSFELGASPIDVAGRSVTYGGQVNAGSAFLEVRLIGDNDKEDLLLVRSLPSRRLADRHSLAPATHAASVARSASPVP